MMRIFALQVLSEPSLNGYYGLMFLMVMLSNQKYRLILAFVFAITTYISGAKFSFLIIPVLLGLVYFFKVKGFIIIHTSSFRYLLLFFLLVLRSSTMTFLH